MGRVRSPIPRSRLPVARRVLADPAAVRRWLVVLALAGATAGVTGKSVAAGQAERSRWGETATVLVTTRSVQPGEALGMLVRSERWPVAHIPARAVSSIPPDGRARSALDSGTPVTASTITNDKPGRSSSRRRLAVPIGPASIAFKPGDRVDVWATTDPSLSGSRLTTSRVAIGGEVASATGRYVVVAVNADEVPDVAEAIALATVTLVGIN